ncbi:3-oxo-tetronate 4-phosphate decarboxylase [Labrenzia sp. DG1229]|uniref:3-oxo-tetronate 4-phosphate decarboxylase n=1 Tax=Labrenzia sp. DG1229 TaxID=681847 RepID=UPI00048E3150|nr:3-oxo-tetronate 4-phosphate decarboxylase [Labrenzia sp. DG1229]
MKTEATLRDEIVEVGYALFSRGYTHGSTGNISVPLEDGWLVTPTGTSLGSLDPGRLSKLNLGGKLVSGDQPTKEAFLHRSIYEKRKSAGAVVHLHSTHSVALSCLPNTDPQDVLPKLTPYAHMQCGRVAMVPYFRPGDAALAEAVALAAQSHWSILLAHHGPVVAGKSLKAAMYAVEELEETAKLALLLHSQIMETLTKSQLNDLEQHFPPWRLD